MRSFCDNVLVLGLVFLKMVTSWIYILTFLLCCFCLVVQLCPTLRDSMDQSTPGTPVFHCLPQFGQTHVIASRTPSNHLAFCRPLLVPSILPNIRGIFFPRESSLLMRWPKHWSLNFRIRPSSEHSGLISLRMDRFDLAVHGILKSLLQHQHSKASILRQSAFFMVQLSLPYITTGKTIALTIRTFVGKVMPLLFKMLSRFVIAFLPRSRRLLIS